MIKELPAPHMVGGVSTLAEYDQLAFLGMRTDGDRYDTIRGQDAGYYLLAKLEEEVLECTEASPQNRQTSYSRHAVLNGWQEPPDCDERDNHARELGDVLWCLSRSLETFDVTLLDVAQWWTMRRDGQPADGTFKQLDTLASIEQAGYAETHNGDMDIEKDTARFLMRGMVAYRSAARDAVGLRNWSRAAHDRLVETGGVLLATLGWIAHRRFGITLQEVAEQNAYKICVRNANGSIFGTGDKIDR